MLTYLQWMFREATIRYVSEFLYLLQTPNIIMTKFHNPQVAYSTEIKLC